MSHIGQVLCVCSVAALLSACTMPDPAAVDMQPLPPPGEPAAAVMQTHHKVKPHKYMSSSKQLHNKKTAHRRQLVMPKPPATQALKQDVQDDILHAGY